MAILIGTDEAGYGPNLGPLVVSATVWEVPNGVTHGKLFDCLQNVITPELCGKVDSRVWMADSKLLYKPRLVQGLKHIERGVLSALAVAEDSKLKNPTWDRLWRDVATSDHRKLQKLPWYSSCDEPLPIDADTDAIEEAVFQLRDGFEQAGVRLLSIKSRTISANDFNGLLEKHGNKSSVLSNVTIGLIADRMKSLPEGPVHVLCDKHGGRNRYAAILQSFFDDFVEVCDEGRAQSIYRMDAKERQVQFCFQAKADNILAAALASMMSKYLRELAMRAFNRFWIDQKSDLKPTAGYPLDAKRFKRQIQKVQAGLGIADKQLWRAR